METMTKRASVNSKRYAQLLSEIAPQAIQSEDEHERLLSLVEDLMDKGDRRSAEEDALLELMVVLVKDFEEKHYSLPQAEPAQMLQHLMEERDLKPRDLWDPVGSKSRVSEILAGKRSISREQAKRLALFFHVPVELFI
jgi:HTH-type transcriptional regulator/antitoxin HigA